MSLTPEQHAYDHWVTVERPGAWNAGYRDGLAEDPSDEDSFAGCESVYLEGYDRGRYERTADGAARAGEGEE